MKLLFSVIGSREESVASCNHLKYEIASNKKSLETNSKAFHYNDSND
jgi:hypothetical protein